MESTIKAIILIFFLVSIAHGSGAKYTYQDPLLNDEMQNLYHKIDTVLKGDLRISSATITNLTVSSLTGGTASAIGTIVQSSQTISVTNYSTTNSTWQATNQAATITPTSASSLILIIACFETQSATAGYYDAFTIFANTRNVCPESASLGCGHNGGHANSMTQCVFRWDAPNTTNPVTYAMYFESHAGTNAVYWNGNNVGAPILVLEISQ